MKSMNSEQAVVLGKILTDAEISKARDHLVPGDYEVQFSAEVDVVMRVGKDYERNVVQAANPWALVAVVLAKLPEANRQTLVKDYLNVLASGESMILEPQAKKAVDRLIAQIAGATRRTVRGTVTFPQRDIIASLRSGARPPKS